MAKTHWWRRGYIVRLEEAVWPGVGRCEHIFVAKRSGREGISWDTLQAIKNDVVGEDRLAIEVFPRATELVYQINARHLWVVPDGIAVPTLYRL